MAKVLSKERPVSINRTVVPFLKEAPMPVVIELPSEPGCQWVAIFDSIRKLHKAMFEMGVTDYTIKQVADASEFIREVTEAGLRIMLNPYLTEYGTTKWTEVQ